MSTRLAPTPADLADVRTICARAYRRQPDHVQRLPSSNNLVFRLRFGEKSRHDRVLKLARRDDRHAALAREPQVITLLRRHRLPCPHVEKTDLDGVLVGRPWFTTVSAGVRTGADLGGLSPASKRLLFQHIGQNLARIHSVKFDRPADFDGRDLVPPAFLRTPLEHWHAECLVRATREGLIPAVTAEHLASSEVPRPVGYALCHGDFNPAQCVRHGPGVTAVVDWEATYAGDPAFDYAVFDATLDVVAPPDLAAASRSAYEAHHGLPEGYPAAFACFKLTHLLAMMIAFRQARRDGPLRATRDAFNKLAAGTVPAVAA